MTTTRTILFATAEMAPVARVGGMGLATAGLVKELRAQGADVTVVMPDYGGVELLDETSIALDVPDWCGPTRARRGRLLGADGAAGDEIVLIDRIGLARPHPYVDPTTGVAWPDNDWRFIGFGAAVAALARAVEPDVLHLNDWHTAAAVGFLPDPPPIVLTIHTLGYQGVTSADWLQRFEVEPWRFVWYDVANPLVGAIRAADRIIAVSPNYATEILTEEQGMGMHAELAARGDAVVGILNGIDTDEWNPAVDELIPRRYAVDGESGDDLDQGRLAARTAILERAGWDDHGGPLLGVVTRLVDQKGVDRILGLAPYLEAMNARIAILGSGTPELTDWVRAEAATRPDRIWAETSSYDEPLAHLIFAGADLFLIPSRFEPCGLAQMQAMAYGAIPIGTPVGGLVDTIIDIDDDARNGTGLLCRTADTAGLVDAVHRGIRALRVSSRRRAMQRRGMTTDWSWAAPAGRHLEVYEAAVSENL